ncbi:GNAT family N-acetyltransferase [Alcanivorax sp. S6407]|uniref:GNAT family N-acetyltransferase n=1 Tax=Alcanivorax sp. S6407 TaxID=2926424 RepID=UPI001FF2BBBB|nr:GNAT family N-acetyltransferase [Alcanivorax sp. S6407]MCK0152753.1 GNAT family N-acetyltransferase [Alcanivorax sp. S6407]
MTIEYRVGAPVSTDQFIELLRESTLGERRPVDDRDCMAGMIANSNLVVSAWDGETLVGISRCVTDFHFACYLSDLAVHRGYQKCGIGRQLQSLTQQQLGPHCKLILLAAPAANQYYAPLGYEHNERCWVLDRATSIS